MVVETLLATAVLLHELLYVTRDGRVYLERCFVPTFGLQLGARSHSGVHFGLMAACVWMAIRPTSWPAHVALFVLLSLVIASYSLRLSNHLVLAWFMLGVLLVADALGPIGVTEDDRRLFFVTGVQALVILTYLLSAFHKLNRDFFSLQASYASQFARFLCWDRGIRSPALVRLFCRYSICSTFAFEALLPILLLVPATRAWGLLLAILFHFSLALLGIVNFSAVMYAGLAAFLPASTDWSLDRTLAVSAPVAVVVCALAVAAVWLVTPRRANRFCVYRHRDIAWAIQTGFGVLTAWLLLESVHLVSHGAADTLGDPPTSSILLVPLLALYALNGLAPYLGFKSEFSMAMFSNLRSTGWNHLVFRDRWRLRGDADYILVRAIDGLPSAEAVAGDDAADLARAALSRPQTLQYRPYFFFEALQRLGRASADARQISARLSFQGREYEVTRGSATTGTPPGFPRWKRVNAFPFVLPLDERAPHSEQGSILTDDRSRQLF